MSSKKRIKQKLEELGVFLSQTNIRNSSINDLSRLYQLVHDKCYTVIPNTKPNLRKLVDWLEIAKGIMDTTRSNAKSQKLKEHIYRNIHFDACINEIDLLNMIRIPTPVPSDSDLSTTSEEEYESSEFSEEEKSEVPMAPKKKIKTKRRKPDTPRPPPPEEKRDSSPEPELKLPSPKYPFGCPKHLKYLWE